MYDRRQHALPARGRQAVKSENRGGALHLIGLLRGVALVLLVEAYKKADDRRRRSIHRSYLANTRWINNWDLVDCSAEYVVGAHVAANANGLLERLARSKSLWERRIAIVATFHFIKRDEFRPTLKIAAMLLGDSEDLIHKAVGWMLREVGQRDQAVLEGFLRRHHRRMPRTALRYAIERFPEELRRAYLRGDVARP